MLAPLDQCDLEGTAGGGQDHEVDGHRRVLAIVLDCADWRLVQYLRTRGELPMLGHLLDHGQRAVLRSEPALTAAAMQSLVHPGHDRTPSVARWLHQLGIHRFAPERRTKTEHFVQWLTRSDRD